MRSDRSISKQKGVHRGGGGRSDTAEDEALVRRGVHAHERKLHPGKPLTKIDGKVGKRK